MGTLRLGVFASGRGSNFQAIHRAIEKKRLDAQICLLLSNNPEAGALDYAKEHSIPTAIIYKSQFSSRDAFIEAMLRSLRVHEVSFVVLAGYMKKIPPEIIDVFRNRMVNIHPALLPSFPGLHVQQKAIDWGVRYSGATVHFVTADVDMGPIIIQAVVPVQLLLLVDVAVDRVWVVLGGVEGVDAKLGYEHRLAAECFPLLE